MKKKWDLLAVQNAAAKGLHVSASDGKPLLPTTQPAPQETRQRGKYNNKRVQIDGIWFASILEGSRYTELKYLKMTGEVSDFKMQVEYSIDVNGVHIVKYRADFVVTYPDGRVEVEDTKGVETPKFILQKKLMLAVHGIRIVLIRKPGATKSKKPKYVKR